MPHVALVGPELEENLSLRYLAASLSAAGFDCDIVPFDAGTDVPWALARILERPDRPALVGLSLAFQPRARDFLALAVALRERGYAGHLTAGGHFATFACREILHDFPEFDTVLCYEADATLPALAAAVMGRGDQASIPGLACRDRAGAVHVNPLPAASDVAALPWPDRRGMPSHHLGHRVAAMVGSRGCYAHCAFCCIAAWHGQARGARYRLRPVDDVADEMAWLSREKAVQLFVFHDDNFFLPRRDLTLARIAALGDALDRRGVRDFAVVVKARPNDLDRDVVDAMQARLGLIRLFLGVESDTTRGLHALGRGLASEDNHRALDLLQATGVYACFNMLVFDPWSTIEDLEANLRFMERYADVPHNFGRVELYAGTPLLARLQADGRADGDYLGWDYRLADDGIQRVFEMAMACFYTRNFSDMSAPHRLMGTRFLVEVARRFHADVTDARWLDDVKALTRALTLDSVGAMREIVAFVREGRGARAEAGLVADVSARLRAVEAEIHDAAGRIETTMHCAACGADDTRDGFTRTGGHHVPDQTVHTPGLVRA
ncbi:MAG: cobalamin-dependent protein [Acidobacteria bacterium]|nr:cobalamin-dependent protein [Acidobacteriota bacterium]